MTITALGAHITNVVLLCAEKQMGRVHARRVVATMEDTHTTRDLSNLKRPRHSVCECGPPPKREGPIAAAIDASRPRPTIICARPFNLGPEPLFGRGGVFPASHYARSYHFIGARPPSAGWRRSSRSGHGSRNTRQRFPCRGTPSPSARRCDRKARTGRCHRPVRRPSLRA